MKKPKLRYDGESFFLQDKSPTGCVIQVVSQPQVWQCFYRWHDGAVCLDWVVDKFAWKELKGHPIDLLSPEIETIEKSTTIRLIKIWIALELHCDPISR